MLNDAFVMELVDMPESESGASDSVWVRVPSKAPMSMTTLIRVVFICLNRTIDIS